MINLKVPNYSKGIILYTVFAMFDIQFLIVIVQKFWEKEVKVDHTHPMVGVFLIHHF